MAGYYTEQELLELDKLRSELAVAKAHSKAASAIGQQIAAINRQAASRARPEVEPQWMKGG